MELHWLGIYVTMIATYMPLRALSPVYIRYNDSTTMTTFYLQQTQSIYFEERITFKLSIRADTIWGNNFKTLIRVEKECITTGVGYDS